MVFKVQKLTKNIHVIRGYRLPKDERYIFVCTLCRRPFLFRIIKYGWKNRNKWQIVATLSKGGSPSNVMETVVFFKNYPEEVCAYVTNSDLKRFYKNRCFGRVEFKNCK